MKLDDIRGLAGPILRPILGDSIEDIVVQADEDGSGEPSLQVDVFVVPGTLPVGVDTYLRLRRSLGEELDSRGEQRFAHLRFRDRRGEKEIEGGEEPS